METHGNEEHEKNIVKLPEGHSAFPPKSFWIFSIIKFERKFNQIKYNDQPGTSKPHAGDITFFPIVKYIWEFIFHQIYKKVC